MKKLLRTSFLGEITLRLLHDLPTEQAGRLIHALTVWIIEDDEPVLEEMPAEDRGAWIAIRQESVLIAQSRKERFEALSRAGQLGGLAKASNAKQRLANDSNALQSVSSRAPAKTKKETKTQTLKVEGRRKTNNTAVSAVADTADAATGVSAVDTPLLPASADAMKKIDFGAWARMQRDPVDVAIEVTGEPVAKRGVYGTRLKRLGRDRFLDTVLTFRAEIAAGEVPLNAGAALTKQLNERIEAMEAMEALK